MADAHHADLEQGERIARAARTGLVLALLAVFCFVVWESLGFMLGAQLFPYYVGLFGIGLCLLELGRQVWRRGIAAPSEEVNTADLAVDPEEQTAAGYGRALALFGWVLAYYALIWVFGLLTATAVFVPALLRIRFAAPWVPSLAIAAGLVLLIWTLHVVLMLRWPVGVVPMPW